MGRYVLLFADYLVSLVRTPSSKFKVVKTELELGLILDPVLVLEPKLEFLKIILFLGFHLFVELDPDYFF
jgi:hypothetical protein